jgi:hypothetical protein
MKMDNDVLLLSYLDKIRLTLTGDLRRGLASSYSGARLYKGPRTATHPQSTTLHSTGTSLCERRKSATATHVEQYVFVLSHSNLLLHNSLHFQHLMWTKGYSFKTPTVKKKPRQYCSC